MSRAAFLLCMLLCGMIGNAAHSAAAQESPVLHSVDEIHRLPADQLSDRVPVDMECVVAYYSLDWPIIFLHDGVTGIYAGGPKDLNVKTGDHVRVRGVLGPARFIIDYTAEPSTNQIVLPAPKASPFQRLQEGHDDSQFVEILGQLVSVQNDEKHTVLEMNATGGGRFRALIPESLASPAELKPLLGRQLRLQGIVGARIDGSGAFIGFQIWIGARTHIEQVQKDGSDVVPVTKIGDLSKVPQSPGAASFFRVHGRMDYQISSSMILVHDSSGTLFVELTTPHQVKVGESFVINGVLDAGMVPPILRFAELSELTEDIPQMPLTPPMSISELVAGKLSGQIVSTRGEFVGPFSIGKQNGFLLQSEQQLLPVFIQDGQLTDIVSGTEVHVTGAWVQQRSLAGFNIGSCALYSRPDGIVIGSQFPWKLIMVLTGAGLIALMSFAWAVTLRRQVTVQTKLALDAYANRRKMEERYANVFINAKVMVVTADATGRITAVNPATRRITGKDDAALLGSSLRDLVDQSSVSAVDKILETALLSSGCSSRDVQVMTANDETVPQEVSCWCTHDENGITVHSIWHDISHRLQMEQQRAEFEQQIVYAQKMESLGVLAGGIAHDFNNLLTVILGNASLIQHTERARATDRDSVACIEQAASRAAELTQQMLAYAGKGIFDVRALNLSQLIGEMSSLLMASVPKSTQVRFDLASELNAVMADATQLRQVVMNLVINGSESLDGRPGVVEVRTSVVQFSPVESRDCIVSFVENATTFVLLQVRDTGSGMDEETIGRMFDPFFTTKFSGRGLGLSTVLGIVRGHKGCIRVVSSPGTGTRFEILLPTTEQRCSPIVAPESQESPGQGTGRVLVIDDEQSVLALICRTLEIAGLTVQGIDNARDAMALFTDPNVTFDCVITDMTMPEMCGDELARNLRSFRPNLPIILCSGFNVSDSGKKSDLAVSAFLKKPFSGRQIVDLTLRLIAESNPFTQPAALTDGQEAPGTI